MKRSRIAQEASTGRHRVPLCALAALREDLILCQMFNSAKEKKAAKYQIVTIPLRFSIRKPVITLQQIAAQVCSTIRLRCCERVPPNCEGLQRICPRRVIVVCQNPSRHPLPAQTLSVVANAVTNLRLRASCHPLLVDQHTITSLYYYPHAFSSNVYSS